MPLIHPQSAGHSSERAEGVGQEQLVEFRHAASRYGEGAWREKACCGSAVVNVRRISSAYRKFSTRMMSLFSASTCVYRIVPLSGETANPGACLAGRFSRSNTREVP